MACKKPIEEIQVSLENEDGVYQIESVTIISCDAQKYQYLPNYLIDGTLFFEEDVKKEVKNFIFNKLRKKGLLVAKARISFF